jgi:hypothetical protein
MDALVVSNWDKFLKYWLTNFIIHS